MNKPTTQDTELQNATEKQAYKPSANQEKWLAMTIQLETDDISKIAEACGIDRSNWYKWQKDPDFVEWYNEAWEKMLQGIGWKLDMIGLKNSKRDYNFWKSMQQRTGRLQEAKGPNVQVNNFIDKKKEEYDI